jgi:hypothetical protein
MGRIGSGTTIEIDDPRDVPRLLRVGGHPHSDKAVRESHDKKSKGGKSHAVLPSEATCEVNFPEKEVWARQRYTVHHPIPPWDRAANWPENRLFRASPSIAEFGEKKPDRNVRSGRVLTRDRGKIYGYEGVRETLTVNFSALAGGAPFRYI